MDVAGDKTWLLPTLKVAEVKIETKTSWLVEGLWLENACGIIGGQPKACKSWLGLDIAVSVASGTLCLGRFRTTTPGRSLVFMAEDNIASVRSRVANIAGARGVDIDDLDLHLITSPTLLLDDPDDRSKLDATIEKLNPGVVLLDPLVRLHRLDENNAREISGLLGFIRGLQRNHGTAIIITHHAAKRGSSRPGQALRGSSDIHAFGDSNLYVSRRGDDIDLTMEHRSAAAPDPLRLRLLTEPKVHLAPVQKNESETGSDKTALNTRVLNLFRDNQNTPISRSAIRQQLKINNQRLGNALAELEKRGQLTAGQSGYALKTDALF
jgi:hypothetical protein